MLILAGITISYVMGDNSVFKKASDAKLKADIAQWQERLELAESPVFIEGLGTFDPDKYFDYIQQQEIINNKDTDVIDNGDGTYDVTTKPGYVFLVTLMPTPEKPTDAEIEYIGQAGKIAPIIKKLEVSATSTSITGKATVSRLGNGIIKYYYKLKTESDDEYKEITNVNAETGATQSTGITTGEEYIIKVVAKNDVGEVSKTAEIIATKIFVESITLNKTEETLMLGENEAIILIATVLPENATNKNVIWESSNTAVVTVSDTGVVTGKTAGTAIITAKATDGSNKTATCTITVKEPTVADIVGEIQETTKTVKDENGNKVVVPGGFKVVPNGTSNVTYNYDTNHNPCVQDGIVIEDEEGNQFVWIPVGQIKNKDGTTTTITLGRYTFAGNGTPMLQQNAANHSSIITIKETDTDSYGFQELTRSSSNTSAKHLGNFVTATQANKGYYLARYEASYKDATHCYSKRSTSTRTRESTALTSGMLWNCITQPNAATIARNMYTSTNFDSDLVNSYAWDTAIVFIQTYSGDNDYSKEVGSTFSSSLVNTGTNGDKRCNIYDMASNTNEWTTETHQDASSPCTPRGGYCYVSSGCYTASRYDFATSFSYVGMGFRVTLYIK